MTYIRLTDFDYDEKLREMGNYLWDLEQQADVASAEGRPALVDEIEKKILRQAERARSFFEIAGPHQVLAAFVAGLGYRMIRRWSDATNQFLSVVELAPMNGEAWLELTWCLAELGRWDDCGWAARKATEIYPTTAASWGNLAMALTRLGRTSEAKDALQRAIQLDPNDPRNRAIEEALHRNTEDEG
ncbi:MAG: tetratricopeptide repeat protein [Verrucomicrobia bacterium]|nr:tetratricopeptide repeat protein [Verrucomicrobiota bacterium]